MDIPSRMFKGLNSNELFSSIKQHFKLLYVLLLSVCFQCLLASGSEGQDQTEPNEKLRKGNSAAFSSPLAYHQYMITTVVDDLLTTCATCLVIESRQLYRGNTVMALFSERFSKTSNQDVTRWTAQSEQMDPPNHVP